MRLLVNLQEQANGRINYYTVITNDYKSRTTKYYLSVGFKKGIEPKESCLIEAKSMFFSCYPSGNASKPKLMIGEYEVLREDNSQAIQEYNKAVENSEDLGY